VGLIFVSVQFVIAIYKKCSIFVARQKKKARKGLKIKALRA
jgi:hypothetical protein